MSRSNRARYMAVPPALLLLLLASGSALAGRFEDGPPAGEGGRVVEDEFIALFEDAEPDVRGKAFGLAKKFDIELSSDVWEAVKGFSFRAPRGKGDTPRGIAMKLAREAGVALVEPVQIYTIDPIFDTAGAGKRLAQHRRLLTLSGETIPTGVRRIEANMTSPPPTFGAVAIIDTGVDLGHPDLNIHGSGGKSFVSYEPSVQDGNGHGTHVSGTVAAVDNGSGVVGVAPGAPIIPLKVLDSQGSGSNAAIIAALDWVKANATKLNIQVVSMSLGGGASSALDSAVNSLVQAGVPVVVAAGNGGSDGVGDDYSRTSPARASLALTVTAVQDLDGLASVTGDYPPVFSNWCKPGSTHVSHTIAGPGVYIFSTWARSRSDSDTGKPGYKTISGTSMATPHISGLVLRCMRGPCAGLRGWAVSQKVMDLARAAPPSKGFRNDPRNSPTTKYYGYLPIADGFFP